MHDSIWEGGSDDDSVCVQSEAKWSTSYPVQRGAVEEKNQIVILAKDEHRMGR